MEDVDWRKEARDFLNGEEVIHYRYRMEDESIRHLERKLKEGDAPEEYTFSDGAKGTYAGFEPRISKQTTMIEYDQNGRKAMRIQNKDGTVQHLSQTKINYMKTGRIENQYTKEYKNHLIKTQQEQLLRTEYNRRRGKVSRASLDDVIKNMPDGEYVSDGTNVMAAPEGIKK